VTWPLFFVVYVGLLLPAWGQVDTHTKLHQLARIYAPVLFQEEGRLPEYDALIAVDFDGNQDGYDNVSNIRKFPLLATLYGGVLAETQDSYYFLYVAYHARDYDTPVREWFFDASSHDNDLEGAMIRVDKASMRPVAMETWFHNLFFQFATSPETRGTQTIDGKLHVEDGTHVILYVDSGGHGIRGFQKIDEAKLVTQKHKIYRVADDADNLQLSSVSPFVRYKLLPLEAFLDKGKGPFGQGYLFEEPVDWGVGMPIGKYFSGKYQGTTGWARPKPPWSWTDKRDVIRHGAWFFHPAYVFQAHWGVPLDQHYVFHWPCTYLISCEASRLTSWADAQKDKDFFQLQKQSFLRLQWRAFKKQVYRWIEYLFFTFG
jgi:hypothetical protein